MREEKTVELPKIFLKLNAKQVGNPRNGKEIATSAARARLEEEGRG